MKRGQAARKRTPLVRVNGRIKAVEVRLVDSDGGQLGVYHLPDALRIAGDKDLDLVEVAPMAKPPVCRIMDYGKYKYEQKKRSQESKKKQTFIQLKEVKFRPKTFEHDLEFKINHIKRFLSNGDKAKVTMIFRGREITHIDRGMDIVKRVVEDVKELGTPEFPPKREGRTIITIIAPNKTKK